MSALEPYKEGAKAILYLLMGVIFSLITYYVVPALFVAFEGVSGDGTTNNIYTYALYVVWATVIVALPVYKAITGIQAIEKDKINVIIGGVWLAFALAITYIGWYLIPAIGNMLPSTILLAMYWTGIIIVWITVAIGIPIIAITKAN